MHRYLLNFSYKGTRFRGSQKLVSRKITEKLTETLKSKKCLDNLSAQESKLLCEEEKSVQGALETALEFKLKPLNPAIIYLSSRTDAGVHAYKNTATVDLEHSSQNQYFAPVDICKQLNTHFAKRNLDLRLDSVLAVGSNFRARQDVCSRTYLYQIVTAPYQNNPVPEHLKGKRSKLYWRRTKNLECQLPAHHYDLYLQVRESAFNLDQMRESLSLMQGTHNFQAFCTASGYFHYFKQPGHEDYTKTPRLEDEFVKTLDKVEITAVASPLPNLPTYQHFQFYHIIIKGKSFLHNQVRRMVGSALRVSSGEMDANRIEYMLQNPQKGFDVMSRPAGPNGLYLLDVEYTKESMSSATTNPEDLPVVTGDQCGQQDCTSHQEPVNVIDKELASSVTSVMDGRSTEN